VLEVAADTANGTVTGLDGLGLQPLEFEMLEMFFVIALEFSLG
jgi:hypothetical protein